MAPNTFSMRTAILHRWSRLLHEATLIQFEFFACFDPLRTALPCSGMDLLFQLFNRALHDPFLQQPASERLRPGVAPSRTASAQLHAAPSHD